MSFTRFVVLASVLIAAPAAAYAAPRGDGGYRVFHPPLPLSNAPRTFDRAIWSDDEDFVLAKLRQREYSDAHARLAMMVEGGNPWAMRMLALTYAKGQGVARDDQAALGWYLRAAEKGDAPAALALAIAFDRGLYVDRDTTLANYWYDAASSKGDAQIKSDVRRARAAATS